MKQTWFLLTLIFLVFATGKSHAQAVHKNSISIGLAAANINSLGLFSGTDLTAEFTRQSESNRFYNFGFSFSQSLQEVLSDDPEILRNPELIRQGYHGTSLDLFTGAGIPVLSTPYFSMPIGAGVLARIRTESYPHPSKTLQRGATNVFAEMVYTQRLDIGLYASVSANFHLLENWSLALQTRAQFYDRGFSIFKMGLSGSYHF